MNDRFSSLTFSYFQLWELQNIYKDLKEIDSSLYRLDLKIYLRDSEAIKLKNDLKGEKRELLRELKTLLPKYPGPTSGPTKDLISSCIVIKEDALSLKAVNEEIEISATDVIVSNHTP